MAATLVADDDANIRELVCLFLRNDGFETLEAAMRSKPNNSAQGKYIPMEGSHYLRHTKYKEIAREFKAYMQQIQ